MKNRFLSAVAMVGALTLLVGATSVAAPRPAPKSEVTPARAVIQKVMQAGGTIAKVQVAFDARDWQLMRFYVVEEYTVTMRSVTTIVKDLSAKGVEAAPSFDAVQQGTAKHMTSLKRMQGRATIKEVKDVLAFGINESQKAHDAATAAIAKSSGR
jgi:hypothetical protein